MAVVGEAEIIVRAITTGVRDDLRRGFSGIDDVVKDAGKSIGRAFRSDFAREAEFARAKWARLVKTGFAVQTMLGSLIGGLASVIVGLGSLAGAAGGAAASLAALGNIVTALPLGLLTTRLALGGVLRAVQQADQGTGGFSSTIEELREQLQQLKFDAEEAALTEDQTALNLERARENLLRVADLPPNSIIRRQAELDFREAELAYRRAKDRALDLQDELANPNQGTAAAGQDPFEGLTPAQKQFAEFLLSLKPILTDLKEAAGDSFLPVLEAQMRRLLNLNEDGESFFLTVREGIRDISDGLGNFVTAFTDVLTDTEVLKNLAQIFKDAADNISQFGVILANYFAAFTGILVAAQPITERFLSFLERKSSAFRDFISVKQATGELEDFFDRAGDLMADLGKIFGNVFGYFGDLIRANFGSVSGGQLLLNWLKDATAGWKNLREEIGATEFDGFMLGASENAKAVLQSIGALINALTDLGDMPEIKETFKILESGVPALKTLVAEGVKAGPILAELLVNIQEILAILGDTSGPRVFFDTLNTAFEAVADILKNEIIADIVNFIGQIGAAALAIGTLKNLIFFLGKVFAGAILLPFNFFKSLPAMFAAATTKAQIFGAVMKTAFGVAGIIAGVALALKGMNDEMVRAREETVPAADELRNVFINTKNGANVLAASFKNIEGSVGVIVDGQAAFKMFGKSAVVAQDRASIAFDGINTSAETVRFALRAMTEDITGIGTTTQNFASGTKESWIEVREAFKNTGTALATIAQSDLPAAQKAFRDISTQYQLTYGDQKFLLESMPELKEELKLQAEAAGLATDDMTLLSIATGKLDVNAYKARNSGQDMVDVIADLEKQADDARREVEDLKQEIFNFGSTNLDAREASRQLEAAIDNFTESLKENGQTLDISTEQGRSNQDALDRLAESAIAAAEANFELSGDTDQLREDMKRAREEVVKAAEDLGLSSDAAQTLADTLVGNDYTLDFKIDRLTAEEAKAIAAESAALLQRALNEVPVKFGTVGSGITARDIYKDGGFVKKFGPGGFVTGPGTARSDSIPALLSNGEYVVNARATAANRQLLEAINSNENIATRSNVNIVVNPSPGMDEKHLASLVSKRLAFELRRGGI